MTPVRLEPAALRSRVKHSTTEPLRSLQAFSKIASAKFDPCNILVDKSLNSMPLTGDMIMPSKFDVDFSSKELVVRLKHTLSRKIKII